MKSYGYRQAVTTCIRRTNEDHAFFFHPPALYLTILRAVQYPLASLSHLGCHSCSHSAAAICTRW